MPLCSAEGISTSAVKVAHAHHVLHRVSNLSFRSEESSQSRRYQSHAHNTIGQIFVVKIGCEIGNIVLSCRRHLEAPIFIFLTSLDGLVHPHDVVFAYLRFKN